MSTPRGRDNEGAVITGAGKRTVRVTAPGCASTRARTVVADTETDGALGGDAAGDAGRGHPGTGRVRDRRDRRGRRGSERC
jgi:hypothetical protein